MEKPEAPLARSLQTAVDAAFERLGRYGFTIGIAGHTIALAFAGDVLHSQMTRPFAHLVKDPQDAPELTINVWDGKQSCVPLPEGVLRFANEAGTFLQADTADGVIGLFDTFESTFSFLDPAAGQGYFCVPDAANLWESARAAPLRSIITWWLQARGFTPLHAGVIGEDGVGVALCGKSGVGKSTTSLVCAEAGLDIVGDDYCMLDPRGDAVEAYSLFSSGKVYGHHLDDLPVLSQRVVNPLRMDYEKAISYLTEAPGITVARQLTIRAIVLLVSKGAEQPAIRRIRSQRALLLLAPSTLLGFPGTGQLDMTALRELTQRLPCFEMDLAADVHSNPPVLRALLQSLSDQE